MQGISKSCSPAQLTSYIKNQQKRAVDSMRGFQPATALLTFCSSMEDMYHTIGCDLDEIHISAIITALANVCAAAQHNRNFQHNDPKLRSSVEGRLQQSLKQLQPMMQGMGAQVVSKILWSSAKLGLNPDEHVPGMVHTSTTRFLQLMHAKNMRQLPNARDTANLLWALTTMHHAATKELVDPACSHFATATLRYTAASQWTRRCQYDLVIGHFGARTPGWFLGQLLLVHAPPLAESGSANPPQFTTSRKCVVGSGQAQALIEG